MTYSTYPPLDRAGHGRLERGRIAQFARGIAALLIMAALVGGIPYGLCRFVGWPLPRQVPAWNSFITAFGQHGIADTTLIDILAVVLWLCWAMIALAFVVEGVALLRYRSVTRLPVAGRLQPLAGALLSAAVLTFAALFARSGGSGVSMPRAAVTAPVRPPTPLNGPLRPFRVELTAAMSDDPMTSSPVTSSTVMHNGVTDADVTGGTYVVRRYDTLWGIAERELGDPTRWQAIFELNRGVPQPGGGALESPHWIYPGWVLRLPAVAGAAHPEPVSSPTTTLPSVTRSPSPGPSPGQSSAPGQSTAPGTAEAPGRSEPAGATDGRTGGAYRPVPGQTGDGHTGDGHTANGQERDSDADGVHSPGRPERAVVLSPTDRIGGGVVAVILAAFVALRLRRRQRYRPRAPRPGRDLRRPVLTAALADLDSLRSLREANEDAEARFDEAARPPLSVVPDLDALATPDRIEVAMDDATATSVELSLAQWPGLVVTGAGAEATLRAWCTALICRDGPYNVEFTMTRSSSARLFAGLDTGPTLTVRDDVAGVCQSVEAEYVSIARLLEANGTVDAAENRAEHPYDLSPLVVTIVEQVPAALTGRWSALCDAARRFGAVLLVLDSEGGDDGAFGEPSGAPRLVVADDGRVERAVPVALAEVFGTRRCMQLGADVAADLLAPVVAVQDNAMPEEPFDPDDEVRTSDWTEPRAISTVAPPSASEAANGEAAADESSATAAPVTGAPVRVRLLGPSRIEAFGKVVESHLRTSAFELFAWFALRPEGARRDTAADVLYPGASHDQGRDLFWTALGNLRSRLGRPQHTKIEPLELIAKVGDHFIPDVAVLDIDLWRFEAALGKAAVASDPVAKAAALEEALASYGGDFCPSIEHLWCEPAREDLHRRAVDAAYCLAELTEPEGDVTATVAVWERTIALDPLAEAPYRRLASVLAEADRLHEAIALGRRLASRLDEIERDPTPSTEDFFTQLRARQRRIDERRERRERQERQEE